MANALYNPFKQQLLNNATGIDLDADVCKASLIDLADYTFDAGHDEYSGGALDVPAAAKVAESGALTTPTVSASGGFDTDDFTWALVSGDVSEAVILWDDTVVNDRLMAFYDTGITGMPVTPNGGNINVTVNASGWFSLIFALLAVMPLLTR
jgi:hypothetical protein